MYISKCVATKVDVRRDDGHRCPVWQREGNRIKGYDAVCNNAEGAACSWQGLELKPRILFARCRIFLSLKVSMYLEGKRMEPRVQLAAAGGTEQREMNLLVSRSRGGLQPAYSAAIKQLKINGPCSCSGPEELPGILMVPLYAV